MCVFTIVTVCGNKLFLSLSFLVLLDLYRLPEGSRSNRRKPGWMQSLMMLVTLLRQRVHLLEPLPLCLSAVGKP